MIHRIMELLRLEKSPTIIKSNLQLNISMSTKPYPPPLAGFLIKMGKELRPIYQHRLSQYVKTRISDASRLLMSHSQPLHRLCRLKQQDHSHTLVWFSILRMFLCHYYKASLSPFWGSQQIFITQFPHSF